MNEQAQPQRAPREWVELITITNPATPIAVRVQTTASGRPLYSMEIGILRDGRLLRHMPIFTLPDGTVTPTDVAVLAVLLKMADEAVAIDAKRKADEWASRQTARGPRAGNDGGRANDNKERRGRKDRRDREREDGQRWR